MNLSITLKKYYHNIQRYQSVKTFLNMEDEGGSKSYNLYRKQKAIEKANEVDIREASW